MERKFVVITETKGSTIYSPFRFKEEKAAALARHMDRLTGTDLHYPAEIDEKDAENFIPFEPIAKDKDGNPREDGKCEEWGLYDVIERGVSL